MKCNDIETYLIDYFEGDLDEDRTDELLNHVEACEACRAELQAYQQQEGQLRQYFGHELGRVAQMSNPVAEAIASASSRRSSPSIFRLTARAAVAVALVALGIGGVSMYRHVVPTGHAVLAMAEKVEGRVLLVDTLSPLKPGSEVRQNQKVKVAGGGYLSLSIPGSGVIEARGGTQLSLHDFPDRLEVAMYRGSVRARQTSPDAKRFVVRTAHLSADVSDAALGVEEGLGRSVVDVDEGAVVVDSGGTRTQLTKDESYLSGKGTVDGPLIASVGWRQTPDSLGATETARQLKVETATPERLVASADPIASTVASTVVSQGVATDAAAADLSADPIPSASLSPTDRELVEFLPENTLYLFEARDWQGLLDEFRATDYAMLTREQAIQDWWAAIGGSAAVEEAVAEAHIREILAIAGRIDGDLAMAVTADGEILLLAECGANEAEIRASLDDLISDEIASEQAFDPTGNLDESIRNHAFVALGRLVFSSDADLALATASRMGSGEATGFAGGEFYGKLMSDVTDPRFMMAADLGGQVGAALDEVTDSAHDAEVEAMLDLLGLPSLDYLLLSPSFAGGGMSQAARLAFVEDGRYGAMDWLAEPAPMRGLDFFSPDVHCFISGIVRQPSQALIDYLAFLEKTHPDRDYPEALAFVAENQAFFDAMGGEIAVAVESPVLPIPNVKIAIELVEPVAFREGLARLIEGIREELHDDGRLTVPEATTHRTANGRAHTIYSLVVDVIGQGGPIKLAPAWAFVDDFFIAGPGPEFVRHSIDVYESGNSIANDSRLVSLLPSDLGMNMSLLIYQDLARSVPEVVRETVASQLDDEDSQLVPDLGFMQQYRAPGVSYAYAHPTHIDIYLNTPEGLDLNLAAVPLIANWFMPRTSIVATVGKVAETEVALEDMAVAVDLFVAQNGRLPASLSEIAHPAGQYIDNIPLDPFALAPDTTINLIEGPAEGQITIYSIGPDGVDDRGATQYDVTDRYDGPGDILIRR